MDMVGHTGNRDWRSRLWPVTARHKEETPLQERRFEWWTMQDLNLRPPACEAGALPTELIVQA